MFVAAENVFGKALPKQLQQFESPAVFWHGEKQRAVSFFQFPNSRNYLIAALTEISFIIAVSAVQHGKIGAFPTNFIAVIDRGIFRIIARKQSRFFARAEVIPHAPDAMSRSAILLTVSFGVETYESYLKWCKEAKKMLGKLG